MKMFITEYFLILCVSYLLMVKNVIYSSCVTDELLKMSFMFVSSWILDPMLHALLVNLEHKNQSGKWSFPVRKGWAKTT